MKKQAAIDWPLVLKLFAGGALTGAGLGAGSSFLRHLQTLQAQAKPDSAADDDVLYLDVPETPEVAGQPRRKRASTMTFAAGGLSGILGTILAYNAVRNAYQKARKRQLQSELDASQQIYLGDLGAQRDLVKGASSQFSALNKGVGGVYLALFLAALGSGVVANRLLQKQFPALKSPNRNRPRKIVVRSRKPEGVADEQTVMSGNEVTPDALEGLVRTNLQMPKAANADGSVADLVGAIADGLYPQVKSALTCHGLDYTLDMVKGARHAKVGALRHNLALTCLCADPLLSEAIQPLVASEFHDAGGEWCMKLAAHVPEEYQDSLAQLSEALLHDTRKAIYAPLMSMHKVSMDLGPGTLETALLAKSLGSILSDQGNNGQRQPGTMDTPVSTESSPPDIEMTDDEAKNFWARYGNDVDNALKKV